MRHFLTLKDFTVPEILGIVKRSIELKHIVRQLPLPYTPSPLSDFSGKTMESGWNHFGGKSMFLSKNDIQLGSGEPIKDTSIVISSMVDVIFSRLGEHSEILNLAAHSKVPVINALTAKYHPLQILADLMTIYEVYAPLSKSGLSQLPPLKIAWVGDANNILNSMLVTYPRLGIKLAVATPKGYEISNELKSFSKSEVYYRPQDAVKDADIIVTDTWVSMGQEDEFEKRIKDFDGFKVTETLASLAKPDWKFMHCLPRKEYEVDDQVFYGPRSLVFQEAENRKYTAMAVFEFLLNKP